MLIDAERSTLFVLDLQARMVPAIAEHEALIANVLWLMCVAQKIGVPVAATEQYPKGLGPLLPVLRKMLAESAIAPKNHFSAVTARCLGNLPGHDRPQAVIVGAEAHVCVLQTALEMLEEGKEVYVVADCVGSRRHADRDMALTRMRDEGIRVVTREMVVFEWLAVADTALFRDVNREFLR
jgi:nicotinamidase-related amidase